jgi:hypothetical protein
VPPLRKCGTLIYAESITGLCVRAASTRSAHAEAGGAAQRGPRQARVREELATTKKKLYASEADVKRLSGSSST